MRVSSLKIYAATAVVWFLLSGLVLTLFQPGFAASPPPENMLYIETQLSYPKLAPDSFGSKPKKYWIATPSYFRMEEAFDSKLNIQQLCVVSQLDIWIMELISKVGQHIKDPEHPKTTSVIFGEGDGQLSELIHGQELEFFTSRKATKLDGGIVNGQHADRYSLKLKDYDLDLYTLKDTQRPMRISMQKDDKRISYDYLAYEKRKFSPNLFLPPSGIKFVEKSSDKKHVIGSQSVDEHKSADQDNENNPEKPISPEDRELNKQIVYFYKDGTPEQVVPLLVKLWDKGTFSKGEKAAMFCCFFAELVRRFPNSVPEWTKEIQTKNIELRRLYDNILWLANTDTAKAELNKLVSSEDLSEASYLKKHLTKDPPSIIEQDFSPVVLDCLWFSFLAGGRPEFVLRITEALPLLESKELYKSVTGSAARWSLKSNCIQHDDVLRICVAQAQSQPKLSKYLNQIVEAVKKQSK